jgi:hypothetical protein
MQYENLCVFMFVCMFVRACVCARAYVCVCIKKANVRLQCRVATNPVTTSVTFCRRHHWSSNLALGLYVYVDLYNI